MSATLESLIFNNTYAGLGEDFFTRQRPTPFHDMRLASFSKDALELLGLSADEVKRPEFVNYLTGLQEWPGSEPLAMLYAGHQFGHWVSQLGDGRAILLGQIRNAKDQLWELQLKGGGPTAYSRGADGRAVLRSTIREYLCSEAMHGLGVPTTRSLAMFDSSNPVYREEVETGAMMIRMAPSHVRFGSFEVFYHRNQHDKVDQLCDYVIKHYYPECAKDKDPVAALFAAVVDKTAKMIAHWQAVGFAHGVMNTDNMSVLGLTLDYGPFGFLDAYNPDYICNHSDHQGRYAFKQQPNVAMWNLVCFGSTLLHRIAEEDARGIVQNFSSLYLQYYEEMMSKKMGLQTWQEGDDDLLQELLQQMQTSQADYTIVWRSLSNVDFENSASQTTFIDNFIDREKAKYFLVKYKTRLAKEEADSDAARITRMKAVNPKFILRNYMAEIAIRKAKEGDFSEVDRLLKLLSSPFDEHPDDSEYAGLPPDWANSLELSCSS